MMYKRQRFKPLHLLVKVDLFHRKISGFDLVRSNEHTVALPTLEIHLSLNPAHSYLSVTL